MKNQILDAPFQNSFSDFLKKGETILWEGKPTYTQLIDAGNPLVEKDEYEVVIYWFIAIIGSILLIVGNKSIIAGLIFFFVMFISFLVFPWFRNKRLDNISYAITQRQVLFRFKENRGKKNVFHSIPFSEIKNIHIIKTYDFERMAKDNIDQGYSAIRYKKQKKLEKMGTIFLIPHQPELIPFETKDLINNNKRHQPTMELLEDVEAVANLIREGIKNVNTLL